MTSETAWEQVELGQIADVFSGSSAPQDKDSFNGNNPFVRVSDLSVKKRTYSLTAVADYVTDECVEKHKLVGARKGTILFPKSGAAVKNNNRAELGMDAYIVSHLAAVYADERKALNRYLYYVLSTIDMMNYVGDPGYPSLKTSDVKKIMVELPPLPEQRKIAGILTDVDDQIQRTENIIATTERLKRGLMQELLTRGIRHAEFKQTELGELPKTWRTEKIGALFELKSGSTPSRRKQAYFDDGTIPWVKTLDLNNSFITSTDEKITIDALRESSCKVIPAGSVLVAMYGGFNQIGRSGVLQMDATTNQAITALLPNPDMSPSFVNYCLIHLRSRWKRVATSSRKDPNITKNDVVNFVIPVPPLQEQETIATLLRQLDTHLLKEQQNLEQQYALKRGLMQDLLSGRVRVSV